MPLVTGGFQERRGGRGSKGVILMARLLMKLCCNSFFGPKEESTCMLNLILKDMCVFYDNFCEDVVQMGREHVEKGGGIWNEEMREQDQRKGREKEEWGVLVPDLSFYGVPLLLKVLKGESVGNILLSLDLLSCLRFELMKGDP